MSTGPSNYETVWAPMLAQIRALKAGGEHNLARVVRKTQSTWRAGRVKGKGVAFGLPIDLPPYALMTGRQAHQAETVIEHARPDTDLVVELGSGWGHNLADIYLSGGPLAQYWAMEPTAAGRACAEELSGLEPQMRLSTTPIDMFFPNYSALPRGLRHALVFSSHAIEQIDVLPEETITGLFSLADEITGVHFEPIGWQMERQSQVGADEAYSRARRYNTNLWPLLKGLAERGEIEIAKAIPDIFGHKRHNVSTLVVWQRYRR